MGSFLKARIAKLTFLKKTSFPDYCIFFDRVYRAFVNFFFSFYFVFSYV